MDLRAAQADEESVDRNTSADTLIALSQVLRPGIAAAVTCRRCDGLASEITALLEVISEYLLLDRPELSDANCARLAAAIERYHHHIRRRHLTRS